MHHEKGYLKLRKIIPIKHSDEWIQKEGGKDERKEEYVCRRMKEGWMEGGWKDEWRRSDEWINEYYSPPRM